MGEKIKVQGFEEDGKGLRAIGRIACGVGVYITQPTPRESVLLRGRWSGSRKEYIVGPWIRYKEEWAASCPYPRDLGGCHTNATASPLLSLVV